MADANQVNDGQESAATNEARESPVETASPQKKRRIRLILIIVAAVAIIGGVFWYARYKSVGQYMQSTNDAFIQADAVTVAPKVSGYVDKVFVGENQAVQAGQPLLQIDTRDYRAQTAQIEAQIGVARANAEGVQAQIKEQQAAIDRAEADLRAAQSDAAFAQAEVARYTPLAASGAESRERLSQLQNQARQANAKVAAANAALAASRRRIGTLNAQVQQARSQGQAARAQLDAAEVNLGSTTIRAAIAGRVGNKTVRVGQFVQAGTRTMSIVPVSQLYIEANFKETQLGLMRPGQPVKIEVDALEGVEIDLVELAVALAEPDRQQRRQRLGRAGLRGDRCPGDPHPLGQVGRLIKYKTPSADTGFDRHVEERSTGRAAQGAAPDRRGGIVSAGE